MASFTRAFRFLLVAWLGVFGLIDAQGMTQLVLCQGEDGHVLVERSVVPLDAAASATCTDQNQNLHAPEFAHCGKCLDVPFSRTGNETGLASRESHSNLQQVPLQILAVALPLSPSIKPGARFAPASFLPSAPAGFRSVVLRI